MNLAGCTRRLVGAWLGLCLLGCQAVLGDFQLEEVPAVPSGLGTTCEPNAFRCDGANLEACTEDRRGWKLVTRCETEGECDASAAACRSCRPSEAGCNDGVRQQCNTSGVLEPVEDCQTAALCVLKGDRTAATCSPPVCEPGEFFCDGNRLRTCAKGRDRWTLVARCASVPLCDATQAADQVAAGAAPTCVAPLCLPGTFACDGATPERCSADQDAWQPLAPCADAASCNALDGSCTPAVEGALACSGADLVRKTTDGFDTLSHCGSALLCDAAAGTCRAPACGAPGTLRCNDADLPALEECAGDGSWMVREVCATNALCSAAEARCFPKACEVNATRCVGKAHQVCSADLTHFETDRTCGEDEVCGPTGCESGDCALGTYRCVEASLELCVGGSFAPQARCATAELCQFAAATCGDPMCGGADGEYQCADADQRLLYCPPDRKQWKQLRNCAAPTPFCDADPALGYGAPICNACVPLTYACAGTDLTRCAADGQSSPTITRCPGGCSVIAGIPSCL